MTQGRGSSASNKAVIIEHLPHEYRSRDQQGTDEENAQHTVRVLVDHAKDALDLALLADALGLNQELTELIGPVDEQPERHRRFGAALLKLKLLLDPSAETVEARNTQRKNRKRGS